MTPISASQFNFAEEAAGDLKINIDMLLRLEKARTFPDAFTDWLAIWGSLLGALAWETYTGIIVLLRADKTRAAYALGRNLFDYFIRLAYYRLQAQPTIAKWRPDAKRMKHVKNGLQKLHAYQDWLSINNKMARNLRLTRPDLSILSAEELALYQEALASFANGETGIRHFLTMLKVVWHDDDKALDLTYALWLDRSAFLHGDPLTRIEMMSENIDASGNANYDILYANTRLDPAYVLKTATNHILDIMCQMYLISDRSYAFFALARRMPNVFPDI